MEYPQAILPQIRKLFSRPVGIGIRTAADPRPVVLDEAEEHILSPRAVERRRQQFALGRTAARDALEDAGAQPSAIGKGAGGEPVWPDGFVGSITHTGAVGIAVVARNEHYHGLGIDLESLSSRFEDGIARQVCTPAELAWVRSGPAELRTAFVFSSKEAIFKAIYPLERVWLEFSDAELIWNDQSHRFRARLLRQGGGGLPAGASLDVHCRVWENYVFSAVALESDLP